MDPEALKLAAHNLETVVPQIEETYPELAEQATSVVEGIRWLADGGADADEDE